MHARLPASITVSLLCYSTLLGLVISKFLASSMYLLFVTIAAALLIFLVKKTKISLAVLIIGIGAVIGQQRGTSVIDEARILTSKIGQKVHVRGVLIDTPGKNISGAESFAVNKLVVDDKNTSGKILVQISGDLGLKRGDTVDIYGTVSEGIGGYLASIYRADISNIKQTSQFDSGLKFREWFGKRIRKLLPEPHASLGLGFLVGEKNTLPEELTLDLRLTGLSHIVVASGFNLTIIIALSRAILGRVSRFTAALGGLILAIGFLSITGNNPSMFRATLVSILALTAWYFGRKFKPLMIIGIVACLSSLVNPYYIWGDAGWYLSFLAFGGVLGLAPLINEYLFSDLKHNNPLRSALVESLSAIFMTLPYSIYVFGQASFVALAANMAVTPIIPFIMLFTFLSGIFQGLPVIGAVFGLVTKSGLDLVLFLINFFARRDPGFEITDMSGWLVALAYLSLALGYLYLNHSVKRKSIMTI